jgi:hypothetical protein
MTTPSQTTMPDDLITEVGQLVFESALMRYLVVGTEAEIEQFESFVAAHTEAENFIEEICAEYPGFEMVLKDEVQAFTQNSVQNYSY